MELFFINICWRGLQNKENWWSSERPTEEGRLEDLEAGAEEGEDLKEGVEEKEDLETAEEEGEKKKKRT